MNPNTRACIAYIVAGLSGTKGSYVYDRKQSKHMSISGSVGPNNENVYDYGRSCHISGPPNNLYDYGNSAHIQLSVNGSQFNGYDYASRKHFSGNTNGNSVSIYDYETLSHYSYSV